MLVGTANLPVAPRDTPWNAEAAKRRVFESCGGNVACLGRAFLWRDVGDARSPEVYRLGFADVIDGRLYIVPKAIAACAGPRGLGTFSATDEDLTRVRARITTIYQRVAREIEGWPESPFAAITADASGTPIEGVIALEGKRTGDRRFIEKGALTWDEGPWPLVFDRDEMDHTAATIGTVNAIERRGDGDRNLIWAFGNLSETEDPETGLLVLRAAELLNEGAVGVSIRLDDETAARWNADGKELGPDDEWSEDDLDVVKAGRIRHVAIVDTPAFSEAKMALAAAVRADAAWFSDPGFGNGSKLATNDNSDERLVWQEPERPEEEGQFGCPLTVTDDGRIYGHAALWGRCHVGYPGTCVRPPKEPAAYRGFLTGERIPGIPTGPLVMKTRHAPDHLNAGAAAVHYDHTGYAPADVAIGPDAYGIWVAGALRSDATETDIEILRASALSGDWRPVAGRHRLVGVLAVNAPGFRIARALAASGALITVGPGCNQCDEQPSLEDRLSAVEARLEELSA